MGLFSLIWSGNFLLAELALDQLSPVGFSVSRFLVATLVLFGIGSIPLVRRHEVRSRPVYRGRPVLLLGVAVLGVVVAPWLGIEGLSQTHAGRAAVYVAVAPAVSLLLSSKQAGAPAAAWLGALLIFLGAGGLVGNPWAAEFSRGDLLLLLATVATVADLHLMRPLALEFGPAHASAFRTLLGGSIYVVVALPWLLREPWSELRPLTWAAVVGGGAIGIGLGQWVKARALRTLGATQVVSYFNLVPILTLVLRSALLDRSPSLTEWLGCLLVVAGATLVHLCVRGGANS